MQLKITRKQFRIIIIVQVFLSGIGIAASFLMFDTLPQVFQDYYNSQMEAPITTTDYVLAPLFFIFTMWFIQNVFAMYKFRSYAPRHYLYLFGIAYVFLFLPPLSNPIVLSGLESALWGLSSVISGFILAIVYFSNLAHEFNAVSAKADMVPAPEA